jgi:large subunit ribosomal protein L30
MTENAGKPGAKPGLKKGPDVDALMTEVTSAVKMKKPKAAAAALAQKAAAPKTAAPKPAASPVAEAKTRTLRVRQDRSGICTPSDQKQTLVGLGLKRIRDEVSLPDTPTVRGQIRKVRHLVTVVSG